MNCTALIIAVTSLALTGCSTLRQNVAPEQNSFGLDPCSTLGNVVEGALNAGIGQALSRYLGASTQQRRVVAGGAFALTQFQREAQCQELRAQQQAQRDAVRPNCFIRVVRDNGHVVHNEEVCTSGNPNARHTQAAPARPSAPPAQPVHRGFAPPPDAPVRVYCTPTGSCFYR